MGQSKQKEQLNTEPFSVVLSSQPIKLTLLNEKNYYLRQFIDKALLQKENLRESVERCMDKHLSHLAKNELIDKAVSLQDAIDGRQNDSEQYEDFASLLDKELPKNCYGNVFIDKVGDALLQNFKEDLDHTLKALKPFKAVKKNSEFSLTAAEVGLFISCAEQKGQGMNRLEGIKDYGILTDTDDASGENFKQIDGVLEHFKQAKLVLTNWTDLVVSELKLEVLKILRQYNIVEQDLLVFNKIFGDFDYDLKKESLKIFQQIGINQGVLSQIVTKCFNNGLLSKISQILQQDSADMSSENMKCKIEPLKNELEHSLQEISKSLQQTGIAENSVDQSGTDNDAAKTKRESVLKKYYETLQENEKVDCSVDNTALLKEMESIFCSFKQYFQYKERQGVLIHQILYKKHQSAVEKVIEEAVNITHQILKEDFEKKCTSGELAGFINNIKGCLQKASDIAEESVMTERIKLSEELYKVSTNRSQNVNFTEEDFKKLNLLVANVVSPDKFGQDIIKSIEENFCLIDMRSRSSLITRRLLNKNFIEHDSIRRQVLCDINNRVIERLENSLTDTKNNKPQYLTDRDLKHFQEGPYADKKNKPKPLTQGDSKDRFSPAKFFILSFLWSVILSIVKFFKDLFKKNNNKIREKDDHFKQFVQKESETINNTIFAIAHEYRTGEAFMLDATRGCVVFNNNLGKSALDRLRNAPTLPPHQKQTVKSDDTYAKSLQMLDKMLESKNINNVEKPIKRFIVEYLHQGALLNAQRYQILYLFSVESTLDPSCSLSLCQIIPHVTYNLKSKYRKHQITISFSNGGNEAHVFCDYSDFRPKKKMREDMKDKNSYYYEAYEQINLGYNVSEECKQRFLNEYLIPGVFTIEFKIRICEKEENYVEVLDQKFSFEPIPLEHVKAREERQTITGEKDAVVEQGTAMSAADTPSNILSNASVHRENLKEPAALV